MRRDYVQPGGQWPATHVPEPSELRELDQAASELVNGDGGGAWAPTDPITIGGAGAQLNASGGLAGPISTGRNAAGGGALILGDNDLPLFTTPKSVTRVIPLRDFFSRYDQMRAEVGPLMPNDFPYAEADLGGVQSLDYSFGTPPAAIGKATKLIAGIPAHALINGAQFTSVTLRMRVPRATTSVPTAFPSFRLWRINATGTYLGAGSDLYRIPTWQASFAYASGSVVVPATLNGKQFRTVFPGVSGGSQPGAFASAIPGQVVNDNSISWVCEPGPTAAVQEFCTLPFTTSATAFFKNGQPQDIVMDATTGLQTHTIDTTTYTYMYEVFDPSVVATAAFGSSSASPNKYHSLIITMGGIQRLVPVF